MSQEPEQFIADFHIHSRYSRATSKDLDVRELAKWAKIKGIGVLGTGDFTHPLWLEELEDTLRGAGDGLYEYRGAHFVLTAEVHTIFYKKGRAHQIHHVLIVPSFGAVERINKDLEPFGNLAANGRPILHMEAWRLVEIVLAADARCLVVPAHVWTPHFAVFGSNSGFDRIEECYEDQTKNIFALETGLSSDPAMNWRLSALDRFTLISNSDAHSARKIGREANVFAGAPSYETIRLALQTKDNKKLLYTIEFFPEEGKYYLDGHRNCQVRWTPKDTRAHDFKCVSCGKRVTVGVMHRIDNLADRDEDTVPEDASPYKRCIPLDEIISEALNVGVNTQTVEREYQNLIDKCGNEFNVLLTVSKEQLHKVTTPKVTEGIIRTRDGAVYIEPGYDGEYGKVRIFSEAEHAGAQEEQMTFF